MMTVNIVKTPQRLYARLLKLLMTICLKLIDIKLIGGPQNLDFI
jgi:hypothetical protein